MHPYPKNIPTWYENIPNQSPLNYMAIHSSPMHLAPTHVSSPHRRMNRLHVTPMHLFLPHVRSVMKMLTLQIIQIMAVYNSVREPEKTLIAKKNKRKKSRKKEKRST